MKPNRLWKSSLLICLLTALGALVHGLPTSNVQLNYYKYQDGLFSGQIYMKNIAYEKVVKVIWSDASGNWNNNGNFVFASYYGPIAGTNYEFWNFNTTIGSAGIKQFYIRYDVAGTTYYDNNYSQNYNVVPTTTTTTATTTIATTSVTTTTSRTLVPSPTSVPEGNSTISEWVKKQQDISWEALLKNVNPSGAVEGFIAASLSTNNPDYFYCWVRDAALVAQTMTYMYNTTEAGSSNLLGLLQDYASFQISAMSKSTVCNCLGEPKFNPDGSSYTGAWGRPQNDSPAERASAFILIADSYIAQGGSPSYVSDTLKPAIYKDLDYVANTWQDVCFDLWEEVQGVHMFTLSVMRKALLDGANFATRNGDASKASTYSSVADSIKSRLQSFWSSSKNYIVVTQSYSGGPNKQGLDTSTIIAANKASMGDGFFTPGSDEMLATAVAIENSFANLYNINKDKPSWRGNAIGRYPEDVYDGHGTSQGNPWFLCTTAFAEMYYRAILEWNARPNVTVNSVNLPFFSKFDSSASVGTVYIPGTDSYQNMINNVALAADKFFSTVEYHSATNGSLSEQYSRDTGLMTGARDLTWSHAAMITAAKAKQGLLAF